MESLWETLEKHSRAKITLLSFIATGLADFKDIGSQSDSSLLPKVLNEQNLTFLVGSFQRQSQLLLSDNAAPLNVTFAAKTTDLGDPNVILVSAGTSIRVSYKGGGAWNPPQGFMQRGGGGGPRNSPPPPPEIFKLSMFCHRY